MRGDTFDDELPGEQRVLQRCLPGVTLYDSSIPQHRVMEQEMNGGKSQFYYASYQGQPPYPPTSEVPHWPSSSEWLQDHRRRKRNTSRLYYGICLVTILVLFLPWQSQRPQHNIREQVQDRNDDDKRRNAILHALVHLDEAIEGDIVLQSPKDKFQEAARVWRTGLAPPLAVIQVATQEDVRLALPILAGLAREYALDFRIQSGGHSPAGYSTVPEGVILSLAGLTKLELHATNSTTQPKAASVVMEPGVRTEDFVQLLLQQDYASVVADGGKVGMGGFVLGGGFGLLSRKFGLAIDNVIRIRVVLTNGDVKDVQRGDDLFWALCGSGGSNFGVVVQIEYAVYPCDDQKLAASIQLPLDQATTFLLGLGTIEPKLVGDVAVQLQGFQPQNDTSPSTISSLSTSRLNGTTEITMYWMGASNPDEPTGISYLKDHVVALLLPQAAQRLSFYYFSWSTMSRAKEQPPTWSSVWGAQSWNGFLMASNNTQEIWNDMEDNLSVIFKYCQFAAPKIRLWGGAIRSHEANETAFPYRDALYHIGVELLVPNTTQNAEKVFAQESNLIYAVWPSIAQHLQGVHVNYPMPDLEDYPSAYWGSNLPRLMQLKEQYDPFHVLTYEQSIPFPNNHSQHDDLD